MMAVDSKPPSVIRTYFTENTGQTRTYALVVLMTTALVVGCACGWSLRGLVGAQQPQQNRKKIRNVATQSQTRYSGNSEKPRFTPMPEWGHGCWADSSNIKKD